MYLKEICILLPFILNFVLLFNRKKKWVKSKYRWTLVAFMFLIALVLYLTNLYKVYQIPQLILWSFMTPLIFSLINYAFKIMSYNIHNRDLYLWIRGSTEIDSYSLSGGKHVKASDRVFSMILLFLVIFLPIIGILILK